MKRLIWFALMTFASAAGAALAVRGVGTVWRKAAHEPPPSLPKWARFANSPLQKKIFKRIGG